jgi:hypothetical protein
MLGVYSRAKPKKGKRYYGAIGDCVLIRTIVRGSFSTDERSYHCHPLHVCFESKADVRTAIGHVRFTPNSDRKSRHAAMVMSAYPESGHVRRNE